MKIKRKVGKWHLGTEEMGNATTWFAQRVPPDSGSSPFRGWRSMKQLAKAILTVHALELIKLTDEEKASFNQILGD